VSDAVGPYCLINIDKTTCTSSPLTFGWILDTYFSFVSTSESTCLQRANDYYSFCGSTGYITAVYTGTGNFRTVGTAPTFNKPTITTLSCTSARYGTCPPCPGCVGVLGYTPISFLDCLKRASALGTWCGATNGITQANAYSTVTGYSGPYCVITRNGNCPPCPSCANTVFRDVWGEQNANAQTESGCLQRANDYATYCQNSGTTTAFFGGSGAQKTVQV